METPLNKISINIYGRGDAKLGDGPSHMGIALYECGSTTCEMHHIRNPTDDDFIYDPRTQPLDDPVLKGRCELASLSAEEKDKATSLLTLFGKDKSNIPEFGIGNCQDWVAAAVDNLERAEIVTAGEGKFWKGMINLSADEMKNACLSQGKKWVDGPESRFEGYPDARFVDKEQALSTGRPIGKLAQNELFRDRMRALNGVGNGETRPSVERPFYMSSPFFSNMGEGRD